MNRLNKFINETSLPEVVRGHKFKQTTWINPDGNKRYDGLYTPEFAGNFGTKDIRFGAVIRFLDGFDIGLIRNIKLKPAERIYRYETDTTKIGGLQPLVKINLDRGLIYFPKDLYTDAIESDYFKRKGVKLTYLNLLMDSRNY